MLTNVTDSETSFARTENLQGSSQLPYTREPSDVLPGISSASNPEQSSRAAEVVINVNEAEASFNNDPYGSQLRLFGHQTSIVEREIDKIFTWQGTFF
ncbi:hypothetical protein AVEN_30922-1 [Araneus ventricosus]|uniref:Uncharacterized protein n=1 Tax=Araneus ventricosus TaxID=182803 RepID=A0A4Y2NSR1_ARAVE|nr:hypothetical protein AVEN_30922-1 [Araneus ventricosus]